MPVTVNFKPLAKFVDGIDAALAGRGSSNMRKAIKQWAVMYRAWSKDRFSRFSRGGGSWAKLKRSTLRGRRRGKGRKVDID